MKPIPTLQMGKNGLSEAFIEQVRTIFKKEQFMKISILKSACRNKTEAKLIAERLMESLGSNYDYKLIGYVLAVRKFRKSVR